jgi:hypothetical protein
VMESSRTFSVYDVTSFVHASGDANPIHTSSSAAMARGLSDLQLLSSKSFQTNHTIIVCYGQRCTRKVHRLFALQDCQEQCCLASCAPPCFQR